MWWVFITQKDYSGWRQWETSLTGRWWLKWILKAGMNLVMVRWGQNDIKFRCTSNINSSPGAGMGTPLSRLSAEICGWWEARGKSGLEIRCHGGQTAIRSTPVFECQARELTLTVIVMYGMQCSGWASRLIWSLEMDPRKMTVKLGKPIGNLLHLKIKDHKGLNQREWQGRGLYWKSQRNSA